MDDVKLDITKSLEDEPKIEFNSITDLRTLSVYSADGKEELVKISGYDLRVAFEMKYLKSLEDVESAVTGISDLFRQLILSQLLPNEKTNP